MGSFASYLSGDVSGEAVEIRLIIPSADRDGQPIDHEYWREEALRLLAELFGGATALPSAQGVWRDDERAGQASS